MLIQIPHIQKSNLSNSFIIGIEGLNGVGKTTLTQNIQKYKADIKCDLCVPGLFTKGKELKSYMLFEAAATTSALSCSKVLINCSTSLNFLLTYCAISSCNTLQKAKTNSCIINPFQNSSCGGTSCHKNLKEVIFFLNSQIPFEKTALCEHTFMFYEERRKMKQSISCIFSVHVS